LLKKLELNKNIDNLDLFKYDYIKKINRLFAPEHDSLSISPLSEILGLKDDNTDLKKSNFQNIKEYEEDDDNEENTSIISTYEEEKEINYLNFLYGSMNNNNIIEDFIKNIQNSVNSISYKDYENKVISFLNSDNNI